MIASTPALAAADGTTKPEPLAAYVAEMLRKLAPKTNNNNRATLKNVTNEIESLRYLYKKE